MTNETNKATPATALCALDWHGGVATVAATFMLKVNERDSIRDRKYWATCDEHIGRAYAGLDVLPGETVVIRRA